MLYNYEEFITFHRNDIQFLLDLNQIQQPDLLLNSSQYKLKIKKFVDRVSDNCIYFQSDRGYLDFEKIERAVNGVASKLNLEVILSENLQRYLADKQLHIEERTRVASDIKLKDNRVVDNFAQFKSVVDSLVIRPLREQQMWDAFFMMTMKKSANFSVPGSGKTTSVLAMCAYLMAKKNYKRIIVVGPINSFGSWLDEFSANFGSSIPLNCFNIKDTSRETKKQKIDILNYEYGKYNLMLFNYEGLSSYVKAIQHILSQGDSILVFDEVHRVKRVGGKYAAAALAVSQESSKYTVVMTGTPLPNGYVDCFNLFNILLPEEYRDYINFSSDDLVCMSQDEKEYFNSLIYPLYCRTSKADLGVPKESPDELIQVGVSPIEQELFDILCKVYRKSTLALFIRILQMELNPQLLFSELDLEYFKKVLDLEVEDISKIDYKDYSVRIKEMMSSKQAIFKSTKLTNTISLIKRLVAEGKPVICWCILKESINQRSELLVQAGISVATIYGGVDLSDRVDLLDKFKRGEIMVLVSNPHTLGESVSLHMLCHDAIYFEYSYNLVHLLQSKDRIHRLGLPENQYTQYWFMQNYYQKNNRDISLADKVYNRLKEKEEEMKNAIERHILETPVSSDEDLELIFADLL